MSEFGPEWVFAFFGAGLLSGVVRRFAAHIAGGGDES